MRVEQEQRLTEDARRFAEQDSAAQRYAAQMLQVTYVNGFILCNLSNFSSRGKKGILLSIRPIVPNPCVYFLNRKFCPCGDL